VHLVDFIIRNHDARSSECQILCHVGNAIVFCVLKVYLVGHMPPGVDERQNGGISPYQDVFQERFNQRYIKLVQKYSDIIVGQFFGHLHSDSFRIVYSDGKIYPSPTEWSYIHLYIHSYIYIFIYFAIYLTTLLSILCYIMSNGRIVKER